MAFDVFEDETFNFKAQCMLGELRCGCGDAGEIMATAATITDGDAASWVTAWRRLGDRVAAIADAAAAHPVSARDAYLRASTYYAAALEAIDGLEDAAAILPDVFAAHRRCFDAYATLLDRPAERVAIAYEGTTMPGYLFTAGPSPTPRPTLIVVNGSDGPLTSVLGIAKAACERGHHALLFDGPGQQSMLFERGIPFRPDWEAVVSPVVDFLVSRDDVDPARLAMYGISQAGFWVTRAAAHEHRLAAVVADPGVVDVSSSWMEHLPSEMVQMLDAGDRATFDEWMAIGDSAREASEQQEFAWRAKPYGIEDAFDLFTAVRSYRLTPDEIADITTPMLIADPEGEQFWPGQSRRLYDALTCDKQLVAFTSAEGADRHCEPMARSLFEQRMFDWLDDVLA